MTESINSAEFDKHLQTVRKARKQVDQAMESLDPSRLQAGKTMAIAWEATYDLACRLRKKPKLPEITALAGIIFKLVQSQHQFLAVESKTQELQTIQNKPVIEIEAAGLSPETRTELEKELHLLG